MEDSPLGRSRIIGAIPLVALNLLLLVGHVGGHEGRLSILASHQPQIVGPNDVRDEQSEDPFREVVDSIKDYAIFLLDRDGKVVSWNQGAETIKGYKAREIIGQHFSRFYPKDAQETKWPERELEMAKKEGRFADEGLRVRKDGSTFWAHVVITALRDRNGELRGFSKVTRDLTEQRKLEQRTRQLNQELRLRVAELLDTQGEVELRTLRSPTAPSTPGIMSVA